MFKNKQFEGMTTSQELENAFLKASQNALVDKGNTNSPFTIAGLYSIYLSMFNKIPQVIDIITDGYYLNEQGDDDEDDDDEDELLTESKHSTVYRYKNVDVNRTLLKMVSKAKSSSFDGCYVQRAKDYPIIVTQDYIIFYEEYNSSLYVLSQEDDFEKTKFFDCVVDKADDENKRYFQFVTYGNGHFDTVDLEIKNPNIDFEYNYNDDLPNDKITDFIKSKDSGLAILHGKPGTGKSTYIKDLIWTYKKKDFILLDSSVFDYITDSSFINLLSSWKNSIIILEDCESMLVDRLAGNHKLSALLNLSDGILGDAFQFKFICTFNAEIGKIDKAILRKGRMKIKYEFKKLTSDKVQKLAGKLGHDIPEGESLTLADVYNYNDNVVINEDDNTVGFK